MTSPAPKPRILLLSLYYPPDLSAGSFRSQALVKALAERADSYDLDVITAVPSRYSSWAPDIDEPEPPTGVRLRRIGLPNLSDGLFGQTLVMLVFMFRAYRVARGQQYAVVVATSSRLMTALLGALIARRQKAVLYLDLRDIFVESVAYLFPGRVWRPLIGLLGRLERWAIDQASRVNLVSKGFAGYFEARYPGRCFSYFSNGIDPLFMTGAEDAALTVNDVSTGPLRILYAGNIGDGQGLHRILPALAERLGSRATFRVIGAGGRLQTLRSALDERGISSVELLPPVRRAVLKQYYHEADVLFLHLNDAPAFRRVLPSKLFEYAATGKPILAGVRGYAAEFIGLELENVGVFWPLDAAEAEAQLGQLQLGRCDRSPFVERYARKAIMRDMAADIVRLLDEADER